MVVDAKGRVLFDRDKELEIEDASVPMDVKHQCYSGDTTAETAQLLYKDKYGCEPERIFRYKNMIWAGPVEYGETEND